MKIAKQRTGYMHKLRTIRALCSMAAMFIKNESILMTLSILLYKLSIMIIEMEINIIGFVNRIYRVSIAFTNRKLEWSMTQRRNPTSKYRQAEQYLLGIQFNARNVFFFASLFCHSVMISSFLCKNGYLHCFSQFIKMKRRMKIIVC